MQKLTAGKFHESLPTNDEILGSVRLDAGELDHLGPLFIFVGDEFCELRGRARNYRAAQVAKARLHLGIGKSGVDLLVELLDNLDGRILGRADAVKAARLVA